MATAQYFMKRLIYIIIVFFFVSIIMFFIYKSVPGEPVRMMLGNNIANPKVYQQQYDSMRESLGLDKSLPVQYISWISKMLTGNFGFSIQYRQDVIRIIAAPLKNTIILNLFSMFFVFLISIPLGILTGVKHNSVLDNTVQVGTIVGYSLPTFVTALLAIFLFAIVFPIFPISGVNTPGFTGTGMEKALDTLHHMFLPMLVMVLGGVGRVVRYVRAAMIDVLRMDYIRTARAKGLREQVVVYVHAFRNALIPIVTIMTGWLISVFGGSVVIESIFLWNGIGKMMIDALNQRDFSVVLTMQMFYVVLTLAGNVIMDIGYCMVDPRVKLTN